MSRAALLALVLSMALAASAAAAPAMLDGGHMSIGIQASSQSRVNFGWNVADLAKLMVGFGIQNEKPEQTSPDADPESETTWQFDVAFNKYVGGLATDSFAPYLGGGVLIEDEGENRDVGWGVRGFFGAEAFIIEHLSVSGDIGVAYSQEGKRVPTDGEKLDGEKFFTTATTAITATVYW